MMVRQAIGVKLGISVVILAALCLSQWLDSVLHAQEVSKPTLEKAFPISSKCKRCHDARRG